MNRPVTIADFKELAKHFTTIADRLENVAGKMEENDLPVVELEANQLFNTYKTNVKKASDSVCRMALVKLAEHIEAAKEAAAAAVPAAKKAFKKK